MYVATFSMMSVVEGDSPFKALSVLNVQKQFITTHIPIPPTHPIIYHLCLLILSSLWSVTAADEGFRAETFCFNINFHAMSMLE